MVAGAWGAATAAIGETEKTEGYAVLRTERRHTSLLRFGFEIWTDGKRNEHSQDSSRTGRAMKKRLAVPPQTKTPAGCRRYNMSRKGNASRDREAQY
jgi:hypothetical protein